MAGLALFHGLVYTWICVTKFRHYLYDDFDLAIFAQSTAGILGGSLFSSIRGMHWLGDHSSLVLFLVAPLYAVFQSPVTLLVVQSAACALGAWPVFLIARRQLGHEGAAAACAIAYLLQPALDYVNLFEFHPEALAAPAVLFLMWGVLAERRGLAIVAAVLALSCREDVALVVLGVAAWAVWLHRRRGVATAVALAGLAAVSLLVTFAWLKPAFNHGEAGYGDMYRAWGASLGEVALNVARRPHEAIAALFATPGNAADTALKQRWWLYMLGPLAFLPLLSPVTLAIALPVVALHLLSSRTQQHTIVYQYAALVTPVLVVAAVQGLRVLARWRGGAARGLVAGAAGLVIVATLCQLGIGPLTGAWRAAGPVAPQRVFPTPEDRAWRPVRDRMLAAVPAQGSVVASFEFLAPLSARSDVHAAHHLLSGTYTYSARPYHAPKRVAALLFDPSQRLMLAYLQPASGWRLRRLVDSNALHVAAAAGDLVLLTAEPDTLALVRGDDAPVDLPRQVRFDGTLEFLGADRVAAQARAGETLALRTAWRRVGTIARNDLMILAWRDAAGRVARRHVRPLGYVFEDPPGWPLNAAVTERLLLRVPADLAPGRYALTLSVGWKRGAASGLATPDDPLLEARGGMIELGTIDVAR